MATVIQVIYAEENKGTGTPEDPVRIVKKLYTLDGKMIVEFDDIKKDSPKDIIKTQEVIQK